MLRNSPFCYFVSFSVVLVTPFINNANFSRDLSIFIIFHFSLFETINVAVRGAKSKGRHDPIIFLLIPTSAADSAAVNPNCIK